MSELPPGKVNTKLSAAMFAEWAHEGQRDKQGRHYVYHCERVAFLCREEQSKIVGYMHDICEDRPDLAAKLQTRVTPETWASLQLLTRAKSVQTYAEYIRAIAESGDAVAIEVKLADLADHLCYGCPPELAPRYIAAMQALHSKAAQEPR